MNAGMLQHIPSVCNMLATSCYILTASSYSNILPSKILTFFSKVNEVFSYQSLEITICFCSLSKRVIQCSKKSQDIQHMKGEPAFIGQEAINFNWPRWCVGYLIAVDRAGQ